MCSENKEVDCCPRGPGGGQNIIFNWNFRRYNDHQFRVCSFVCIPTRWGFISLLFHHFDCCSSYIGLLHDASRHVLFISVGYLQPAAARTLPNWNLGFRLLVWKLDIKHRLAVRIHLHTQTHTLSGCPIMPFFWPDRWQNSLHQQKSILFYSVHKRTPCCSTVDNCGHARAGHAQKAAPAPCHLSAGGRQQDVCLCACLCVCQMPNLCLDSRKEAIRLWQAFLTWMRFISTHCLSQSQ